MQIQTETEKIMTAAKFWTDKQGYVDVIDVSRQHCISRRFVEQILLQHGYEKSGRDQQLIKEAKR